MIENGDKRGGLGCLVRRKLLWDFLTTEAAEAGSLGARRTPNG